ncbi:Peptidase S24/S26A/S26B, conserved region [Paludibacter propionicigenes WB4]|uniref:Peptidase S24/S26A/S26B, conserved region n=1 Tax=Paludibacter propionicigenes (strain DSM 17365 / JCM 13257 / WB4) TaxID=694427 RepID=E4T1G2_PALPW|nr:S24 family peptidase [Paludibacter propionicigenes]ADQ78556.1 Peptidase S24/S26A/S26B, conserved region [Paludibacter propionicigenes WB4]
MKSLILNELKRHYNFKKDVELAKFLEITPQILSNWDSRGTFDLHKIYTKCVDVSPDWILSNGQGNMLRSNYTQNENEVRKINLSKPNNDLNIKIHIVDTSVITKVSDQLDEINFNVFDCIVLPKTALPDNYKYLCINMSGNSMLPTLYDKDKIVVRLLKKSEWYEMPNEHVYVVVDKNKKTYIKRVRNKLNNGFIVCTSDNLDKMNYPCFNIAESDIMSIWHVELYISSKMININENYINRLKVVEDRLDNLSQALNR